MARNVSVPFSLHHAACTVVGDFIIDTQKHARILFRNPDDGDFTELIEWVPSIACKGHEPRDVHIKVARSRLLSFQKAMIEATRLKTLR